MTSILKNVYIAKLENIVNRYNNTYHKTIKMKSVDVTPSVYIDFNKENNSEGPRFKLLSRGFLWLKKSKTLGHGHFISDLNGEEIIGTIYGKELQKTNQKEFRVEKVIKRKSHKLYIKWESYGNSFNSWIDGKDII